MLDKNFIESFKTGKNRVLLLPIIIVLAVLSFFAYSAVSGTVPFAYREDALLLKLVKASGAEFNSLNITGWARVTGSAAGSPTAMAEEVAARLGLPEQGRRVENWRNQYAGGAKVVGEMPGGRVVSVLGQVMELPEGENVSHVMVSMAGVERGEARFYRQKIRGALSARGSDSHVAVTYSGKIDGVLSGKELLASAEKLMALTGAAVQEQTAGDTLVSLTGHTSLLSGGLSRPGKEMNLNVALRSNPVERVTYVYVASPVIYTEY